MAMVRLLIIDDDAGITATFARALRTEGYAVQIASTAAAGLLVIDGIDVVIVDLRMPFINGLGFLYRLRMRPGHQHTPVLLITGDCLDDSELMDLVALEADVAFKPIWVEDLVSRVGRLLSRSPVRTMDAAGPQASPDRDASVAARGR
jgi:DNA-binding response OmpR family regulator